MARKEYRSLGSDKLSTTIKQLDLAAPIDDYKELIFWLRNISERIYASTIIPSTAFRTFTAEGRSIGLEVYVNKRVYTSIWYNSNTSVACVSSETSASFYWQILGVK